MSFITDECLLPSSLDLLGSIDSDILNDHASQAPDSNFDESSLTQQLLFGEDKKSERDFEIESIKSSESSPEINKISRKIYNQSHKVD